MYVHSYVCIGGANFYLSKQIQFFAVGFLFFKIIYEGGNVVALVFPIVIVSREHFSKNMNMTLSEFKWIWWMEFAHRTWGRAIGACVFLPAAYFWARGSLDRGMKVRVGVYCALVAAQVRFSDW